MDLVGRSFGEFVVREPLSSGGFAQVFRAEQPALAREAVIKVLQRRHMDSDTVVQRFLREAQLASKLDHPFAAHTYAFGAEPDGVLWIAMELVRGTPLDRLLEAQGPIPLERFVPLVERICEVIHTAHEQGIVHRDLKPGNVMVLARAGRLLPKLLDFGIAKEAGTIEHVSPASLEGELSGGGRLTELGSSMGSPLYMAPEQWVDAGAVDARTDQYALGVLCYEALTGKPPFTGATRIAIARAHAQKQPPPLGEGFPPALDAVLARAMAKRAADRYASVLELATAFRAASGIASEAVALPRLAEAARTAALASAPSPLADAVAALEAARNPHQARDAIWQLVRVATRLVGVIALAGHAHVGGGHASDQLRKLSRPSLTDDEWLELARALVRPFAAIRDAHPVPELVAYDAASLSALIALRTSAPAGASDERVRELLDRALPLVARLLAELAWLSDYPLVVPDADGASVWMGVRRGERARMRLSGGALPLGEPALVDRDGVRVVSLAPFVQLLAPAPGAPAQLFFFDGKGRRGARLAALPDPFEREDEAVWSALDASVRDTDPGGAAPDEERCPFPGLAAFGPGDASRFFGRERETEAFVNRLRIAPLLAVVGPSGAGKSSFVQAGVIPALPDGWEAITVRPGAAPLDALAARLHVDSVEGDALGEHLRARRAPTVLVIDQLEELFTLCQDHATRERFADALARAARAADDPVRVVLTLRDDFLLHVAALPAFRTRLTPALQLLTTPAAPELRRIFVEPIERAGYELDDPQLPDDVVAALADTPAALPLLSFTGEKLWELRDRRFRQLGRKAYESLGGVGGALAQHAEDTLRAMPAEEQRLVREVFRHAVTANGTRAVLARAELDQVLGGGPHAAAVIEQLVGARLLVVRESDTGDRIEIAHEALLEAWPRLVTWRREDREGAKLRDQLRAAARQWDERGRPAGLLWRGDALTEYRLWRSRTEGALTQIEDAFTSASLADATRGRRIRVGLLVAAFTLLTAGVIALLFLNARATANARELHDNLQRQYEDQGRRLVLAGDPMHALAFLAKAEELGARGVGHDFLIAQAVRATDGEQLELRHDGPARSPRFSPDGTRLVTAGLDHVAKIWDARTGALLHTLAHDGNVVLARFSPDGTTVATASFDKTAALWDARTGARLRTFAHDDFVWCAQYSPDGKTLVTASRDQTVKLWDVATGALRVTMRGERAGQRTCAFSPDGARIAVGDEAGVTRVWDAATGAPLATLATQHGIVKAIGWSPDGARLVTASVDGTAVEYDVASATALHTFDHHLACFDATFSPDGKRIATAANDNTAVLWDADTGARLLTLAGHSAGVATVMFTPDGARVITTSADATARLWDATTGRTLARWIGHRDMVLHGALDAKGERLVTAGEDGSVMVWSVRPTEDDLVIFAHPTPIDLATFSPDGTRVVSAGRDGTIRIWDADTGAAVRVMRGHTGAVLAARYSPDGAAIASAGEDGTVRIWDAASGDALHVLAAHHGMALDVSWAPDGATLASAGIDGVARVWSRDGDARVTIPAVGHFRLRAVRFTPAGTELATTGEDNTTRFYDPSTGRAKEIRKFYDTPNAVAFDRTGAAASPVANRSIRVWDTATGFTMKELVGHEATTNTAEWSPDGTMIVSTALDGTARLWDVATGDLVATFPEGHQVLSASFSPDGTRVVTSTNDGTVAIRRLPRWKSSSLELDRLLRCRVPFRVRDGQLVEVGRDRAECSASM